MNEDIMNNLFKDWWFKDGFKIEHMYHFTSIDSLIKILLTDKFRLSLVENMNDINESQPNYKRFGFNLKANELNERKEKEEEFRSRTFLGCFNILKENENIRDKVSMWGHYGDRGRGVALKVNKDKLDELLFPKMYDLKNDAVDGRIHINKFRVNYKEQELIDENNKIYLKGNFDITKIKYVDIGILFKDKSKEWERENEFRYVVYNSGYEKMDYFYINDFIKCIDGIFIGDIQTNESLNLIKDIKIKLNKDLSFYRRINEEEEEELIV